MAGKAIEPEEVVMNRQSTVVEAQGEKSAQTVPPEVACQIEGLVERAAKSRAWASAQEYFRRRFQGAQLDCALQALAQAEQDASEQAQAA
jgi:hypothetical protein